jgi:RES domain-containing protein
MATIELPDDVEQLDEQILQVDWNAPLAPDWMKKIGDEFAAKNEHLALKVPSVLLPGQYNYLVNPLHPLARQVKLLTHRQISFDQRLVLPR